MNRGIKWQNEKLAVMTNAYQKYSLEYCLDSLERLGVRQLDLWGGEPHFYAETATYRDTKAIARMVRERELQIVCFTPEVLEYPYNIAAEEPEIRKRTWLYGKKSIEICEDMGIPQVLFGPGWVYENGSKGEGRKRAAEMLARFCEEAERRGVRVATQHLTSLSSNLIQSAMDLDLLLELSGRAILEAVIDVSILYGRGETEEEYWKILGEKIGRIHFMDGKRGQISPHLAVGDGNLPLQEILQQFEKWGYTRGYTLEINAPQYREDPEGAIGRSLEAIRKWLV